MSSKTRWYLRIERLGEGRYKFRLRESPEEGIDAPSFERDAPSLEALEALLQELQPARFARLLIGAAGGTLVPEAVPEGETVETRISDGLLRVEGPEGCARFMVVGASWDGMERLVFRWDEKWRDPKLPRLA